MLVHSTMMIPWTPSQISQITKLKVLASERQPPSLEWLLQLTRLTSLEAGGFSEPSFAAALRALTNLEHLRCHLTDCGDRGAVCRSIETCSIPNVLVSWRSRTSGRVVGMFKIKGKLESVSVDTGDSDWARGMDSVPVLMLDSGEDDPNLPGLAGIRTHSLSWYFLGGVRGLQVLLSSLTTLRSLDLTFFDCQEVPPPRIVTGLTKLWLSKLGWNDMERSIEFMTNTMASNCSTLRELHISSWFPCWAYSATFAELTKLGLDGLSLDLSPIFHNTPVVRDLTLSTFCSVHAVTRLSGLQSLELDNTPCVPGTLDLVAGMSGLTKLTLTVDNLRAGDCHVLEKSRAKLHLNCRGGRVPDNLTVLTNLRSLTGGVAIVSPDVLIGCVCLESVAVEGTMTRATSLERALEERGICARVTTPL